MREALTAGYTITGEKGLVVKVGETKPYVDRYELLPPREPPWPGTRVVYSVRDKVSGAVYTLVSDPQLDRHWLVADEGSGRRVYEVKFRKAWEKTIEKEEVSGPEVYVPGFGRGRIMGASKCSVTGYEGYTEGGALPLQTRYVYFDCYYTTKLGSVDLVSTHASGYIYYIPGSVITQVIDTSYDQVHTPIVAKCWFTHQATGAGSVAAMIRADGKYMLCYAELLSTQWTQYSILTFDVWENYNCDGRHSSWVAFGCGC